jgi:glycosyltransferase involved in cell wall biosynthesis
MTTEAISSPTTSVAPHHSAADLAAAPLVRHPRRGEFPVETLRRPDGKPLKLAIVYIVCYRYRVPIFRRLTEHPDLNVKVFVGSGLPGTKMENAENLDGLDVTVSQTWYKRLKSTDRDVALLFNPLQPWRLLRFNPDVILIQGGEPINNLPLMLYAKLFRKPVVWWTLGEIRGQKYSRSGKLFRTATQFLERRATAFLGYSSVAVDYFLRMGYAARRCFNLVNVVDTNKVEAEIVKTRDEVEPLREQLGLRGKRVVLYVGAIMKTKKLDRLIRAFASLPDPHDDLRLLVVGDGPFRAECEQIAAQQGVANRTIFTGAVYEGVARYFQLANLVVLPGMGGLVVSEAMTHGLPIISSVGDGSEFDLIVDGENGYAIGEHGDEELADAMRRVLDSPEKAQAMGREGRRMIETQFNIDRYFNEMLASIFFAYRDGRGSGH